MSDTIIIATRGSALALVQANQILDACRAAFPDKTFEIQTFKTTGDKNLTASLANPGKALPKGLFTKELEVALLAGEADLAVHSLKDLPTELPDGLTLGATTKREDARDTLVWAHDEGVASDGALPELPQGATVATSSNRRKAQLLKLRPDLNIVEIRGNVATRLRKLKEQPELHATILAAAGLNRLGYTIGDDGVLSGDDVPEGVKARRLEFDEMLPCVGQAAIGIEIRENDPRIEEVCAKLTCAETLACVTAERAFLAGMGGGCATPVAARATVEDDSLTLKAISFVGGEYREAERHGVQGDAVALGCEIASMVKSDCSAR
jgi:hydroxymethylbilane synthase